jgi:ribosome-associated protein
MTAPTDLDIVHRWCALAAQAAADKKATDPVVLDVGPVLAITDAFVITSAPNDRLVRTIVEEVERRLKESGGPVPLRIEGRREAQWVLMDYGDFVVHVFNEDMRAYYDLERLWSDAPRVSWDNATMAMVSGVGG